MRRFSFFASLFAVALTLAGAPMETFAQARKAAPDPLREMLKNSKERLLPWRPLTRSPRYHWFSYYEVRQFDPTGRYALAMAADFEMRQPTASDTITIGMIDLKDHDRWTTLGTTTAWCWQQGCRLQWRPGSDREVLWNDRENGNYICRILDVKTGKRRTLPTPIDHLSPDGKWALVADFARTGHMRGDYGYQGIEDPYRKETAPRQSGVWKVDLETGARTMLFSLADIAAIPSPGYTPGVKKGRHYINHLSWSPDGRHFMFLNRGEAIDRMFTADADGKNLHYICRNPSHYAWRDSATILCWTNGAYRLFKADGSTTSGGDVLFVAPNGHQTYLPGGEWLLTDTYPQGRERLQYIYLYNLKSGKKIIVGKFPSPRGYDGPWRCDTHPRLSPDGRSVTIDSPHQHGRQIYLADISAIVNHQE